MHALAHIHCTSVMSVYSKDPDWDVRAKDIDAVADGFVVSMGVCSGVGRAPNVEVQ